jgi:hypothetical protein
LIVSFTVGYYSGEEEAGEDCPLVKGRPVHPLSSEREAAREDRSLMKGRPVRPLSYEGDRRSSLHNTRLLNITQLDEITFADE